MQALREPKPAHGNNHGAPNGKVLEQRTTEAIREQLERLLSSPRFASSPRCQHLLRYVVEESLLGRAESLKERNLGFEVFKREAAYDTNADPVVRVAAGEVRKKLAQYYYELGNQDQVRIELPTGSYAPQFSVPAPGVDKEGPPHPAGDAPSQNSGANALAIPDTIVLPDAKSSFLGSRAKLAVAALAACFVAACLTAFAWHAAKADDPLDAFWAPVVKSPNQALLCIGQLSADHVQLNPDPARNPLDLAMAIGPNGIYPRTTAIAAINDAITAVNVAGLLRSEKKQFTILPEGNTSYEDLQKSPAVLVGALDNDWTIYMTRGMRFRFNESGQTMEWWVTDQQNLGARFGVVNIGEKHSHSDDAAIVARIVDSETKQPVIIVAGVTSPATRAAGEFVTNSQSLGAFLKTAPSNWQTSNLEILLSVNVINGEPGPPRVTATAVWK